MSVGDKVRAIEALGYGWFSVMVAQHPKTTVALATGAALIVGWACGHYL